MAATHRVPKQWPLTRSETINSFENWKQNIMYALKLDPAFLISSWKAPDGKNVARRSHTEDLPMIQSR